jgi:hypothetical protein
MCVCCVHVRGVRCWVVMGEVLMGEVVMGEDAAQAPYWQLSHCSSSMGSIGTT